MKRLQVNFAWRAHYDGDPAACEHAGAPRRCLETLQSVEQLHSLVSMGATEAVTSQLCRLLLKGQEVTGVNNYRVITLQTIASYKKHLDLIINQTCGSFKNKKLHLQ